jgi:uncharacterized low-complexity protein
MLEITPAEQASSLKDEPMKFFASAAVVAALALAATPASALERPVTPTAGDTSGSTHQTAAPQTTDGESRPAGAGESRPTPRRAAIARTRQRSA